MELNAPQREAVHDEGHALCILAGAGSGKTRVITHRVQDLLGRRRADPSQVLAVTFTNKAAREMRERVEGLVPGLGRRLCVATFHSTCARFLRDHGAARGLSPHFTIYDEDDSARLLSQLFERGGGRRDEARAIYRRLEQLRNDGDGTADEVSTFDIPGRQARELLPAYEEALRRADACDFAGLLLEVLRILEADGPEAQAIFARVRHLLVDEYQDTNRVQARLVSLLGRRAESVTVVGDDDQSIYAWRGAHARNLVDFLDAFPAARVVRLEENYRSTQRILEAANAVIESNPDRLEKKLFTRGSRGERLRIVGAWDDRQEARVVLGEIQRGLGSGLSPAQIAVLYRTNAQSRVLEDALRRARRPYRIVGGVRFYDRKEVKDVVAYLRLAVNPRSDVDVLRVINVPARGVGDTTRLRLVRAARSRGVPLAELMREPSGLEEAELRRPARQRVRAFATLLASLPQEIEGVAADEAVQRVAIRSGLVAALESVAGVDGPSRDEAEDRLQNIGALVEAARDFVLEARRRGEPTELTAFLEQAALATDNERMEAVGDDSESAITLMTLHAAKGLEFDQVILCGMEEGLFPHARDGGLEDTERLAEERRLCYVGITRARRRLTMTHARRRNSFGETRPAQRSRFLDDVPDHLVEAPVRGAPRPTAPRPPRGAPPIPTSTRSSSRDIDMDFCADFIDDEPEDSPEGVAVGARVLHATFGEGVVQALEGHGPRGRLVIRFAGVGVKRIVAKYVTPSGGSAQ